MDDLRIGEKSSGTEGPTHGYPACELQIESLFQMYAAFLPEGAEMEPEKTRRRHDKQGVEQRAQRLDGVEPKIDHHNRKAPSDLLPLARRRSLRVGHHVKRKKIEACRSQRAQDESLHG